MFLRREALTKCLSFVNIIFRDVTVASSPVSDVLVIKDCFAIFQFPGL